MAASDTRAPSSSTVVVDRRAAVALTAALILFLARVVAQLVQWLVGVAWLPSFESWQSGALPYPALLASQLVIIGVQVWILRRVAGGRFAPAPPVRRLLRVLGTIYFAFMVSRLLAGLTVLDGHSWFDAPLPSLFHLVLAVFVLVAAEAGADEENQDRALDIATYPAVMVGAVAVHVGAVAAGAADQLAAYGAVAVGALAIVGLEVVRPHRAAWRPDRSTVFNDAAFLAVVQMLLPLLLSAGAVFALAAAGRATESRVHSWWPHEWPVVVQVVLMLVIGDFFRYWMHRAFHARTELWRFHAVHHSPPGLYWLNVGRFHPLEKAVQLLVDSLPFVLLGVSEAVLAGYFVLYAVNGFFQHSNCRVHLGWANYLISGPELHRWHHSRIIAESDNNYGNNLIVWDVLFGTRFLPPGRHVDELGLHNRHYPAGFVSQMATPFRAGLDKANQG